MSNTDKFPAGEPVAWLESEESARGKPIKEVMRGMIHTAVWHFSQPQTKNPVWTLHAPATNAGQAQSINYDDLDGDLRSDAEVYDHEAQAAQPHDEDAAIRLRAICNRLGIGSHVPQDNATLWGTAFAVLGQIRAAIAAQQK